MSTFPVQYSTLSSTALAPFLSKHYGLPGASCRLLIRNVSDTYILETTTTKYIFKIYRDAHRKPDEIRGEVELLLKLQQGGAKVSYPIPATDGEYLTRFEAPEGIRYGVLFTWANGSPVAKFNKEQLEIVGREMATLHNISAGIDLQYPRRPFNSETTIRKPLQVLVPAFKNLPEEYNWLQQTGAEIAARMEIYQQQFTNTGYCQFDFLPKNFHLDEQNNVTFFDFDFAGKGLIIFDITTFFIHFFLDAFNGRLTEDESCEAFWQFLISYRQTRPVSDEEIAAIPDMGFAFWLFYLGFQYESFDDWSNIFWGEPFIKARIALIKKWMDTAQQLLP